MKKIIDGKTYNTETAKKIAEWDNGLSYNDFDYRSEELYRKRTGEYFLYGSGGARTEWGTVMDDGWLAGGSNIVPLTQEEAQDWLRGNTDE